VTTSSSPFFNYEACLQKVLAERLPQLTVARRQAFALNPGETLLPEGFAKAVWAFHSMQPPGVVAAGSSDWVGRSK
jgi:hypothetical protein